MEVGFLGAGLESDEGSEDTERLRRLEYRWQKAAMSKEGKISGQEVESERRFEEGMRAVINRRMKAWEKRASIYSTLILRSSSSLCMYV